MFQTLRTKTLALAVAIAAPVAAFAQEAVDPFQGVLDNVTTKVETYAGSLVVLAGVAVVFMVGIKYIKKLRGAA
jgi:hypothetical protein